MEALNFRHLLFQPYPYYYNQQKLHQLGLLIIFLCFAFNFFFEPFEVYRPELRYHFIWICLVHSIQPAFIGYGYFTAVNYFSRSEEEWTVGKEILHLGLALLLIGVGNFLIRDLIYDNPRNWSWRYLLEEVRNAFLVGGLFTVILVPLNFNRLFRKYHHEALSIRDTNKEKPFSNEDPSSFYIKTKLKGDDFNLNVKDFLFAKAAGNYVEIFIQSEEVTEKLLKRITIKDLEQQLAAIPWIFKTHRAYLINTHMIRDVQGNAQGYQLTFENCTERIPVSRSMISAFNATIQKQ